MQYNNEFGNVSQYFLDEQQLVPALKISHKKCHASISLLGGQLLSWQPENQQPVLWLSKTAEFSPNKAIRGGVPICWPWFGPYKSASNHGFARQNMWDLSNVVINSEYVEVILNFSGSNLHPLWPHAFSLTQTLIFAETLSQQLTITNLSEQTVEYTGALHSYFRVSSPQNISIDNLADADFYDKLSDSHKAAEPVVPCVGPVDRVYESAKKMEIIDSAWQRIISVESSNCQQWVLWNPGFEESKKIADIHPEGAQEYICLEAANTHWQKIAMHSSVTMAQKISIQTTDLV
jgi:glucose-6-phosphate 1-epimerase